MLHLTQHSCIANYLPVIHLVITDISPKLLYRLIPEQASDILIAAKEIEKTRDELCRIISEHSGQPFEKVFADADRDYWMNAEEALAYGMVDKILRKKKK